MNIWLKPLTLVGLALGVFLTGLGRLASWWPALDIVNNGLPFLIAGAILVVGLAFLARDWRLIATAIALLAPSPPFQPCKMRLPKRSPEARARSG